MPNRQSHEFKKCIFSFNRIKLKKEQFLPTLENGTIEKWCVTNVDIRQEHRIVVLNDELPLKIFDDQWLVADEEDRSEEAYP